MHLQASVPPRKQLQLNPEPTCLWSGSSVMLLANQVAGLCPLGIPGGGLSCAGSIPDFRSGQEGLFRRPVFGEPSFELFSVSLHDVFLRPFRSACLSQRGLK